MDQYCGKFKIIVKLKRTKRRKKIIEREHISHKIMRYNEIGEAKVMCASERISEEEREREREGELTKNQLNYLLTQSHTTNITPERNPHIFQKPFALAVECITKSYNE